MCLCRVPIFTVVYLNLIHETQRFIQCYVQEYLDICLKMYIILIQDVLSVLVTLWDTRLWWMELV